jgi:hypothetical protein
MVHAHKLVKQKNKNVKWYMHTDTIVKKQGRRTEKQKRKKNRKTKTIKKREKERKRERKRKNEKK